MAGNPMTRRDFLVSLAAAAVLPSAGSALALPDDWFEDLRPDRYYTLQGGHFGDTGGYGGPYPEMCQVMRLNMLYSGGAPDLEARLADIESGGYYLTPTQYHGKPFRSYGRIPVTARWLREFERRHSGEDYDDWQRRYDTYYAGLRASGWKPEYDRMSREELVALGWKGVDTYRKEG